MTGQSGPQNRRIRARLRRWRQRKRVLNAPKLVGSLLVEPLPLKMLRQPSLSAPHRGTRIAQQHWIPQSDEPHAMTTTSPTGPRRRRRQLAPQPSGDSSAQQVTEATGLRLNKMTPPQIALWSDRRWPTRHRKNLECHAPHLGPRAPHPDNLAAPRLMTVQGGQHLLKRRRLHRAWVALLDLVTLARPTLELALQSHGQPRTIAMCAAPLHASQTP